MPYFKRLLAALFLFLGLATAFAQEDEAEPSCPRDARLVSRQPRAGVTEHGCVRERSGARSEVRVGRWLAKDEQGRLLYDIAYDDAGVNHGKTVLYYRADKKDAKTSVVQSELFYSHGQLIGLEKQYYPGGELKEEAHWYLGKLHGLRKRWSSNGKGAGEECWLSGERELLARCNAITYHEESLGEGLVASEVPSQPTVARRTPASTRTKAPQ